MGYTQIHTDLMFTALDYFIGDDTPVKIFRDDLGISFETALGNQGLVVPNEEGNWDIILNNSKIYEIENEIYSIITHEGNTPSINEYMKLLKEVSELDIKDKSRGFLNLTLGGISILAVHGKIKLDTNLIYGPYLLYTDKKGETRTIILN
jgi:hypothetical protein